MDWTPLDSELLSAVAYKEDERALYLRFRSGEAYRYLFFYPGQFRDFMAAQSKGTWFARHIRDKFPFEKLPREATA